MPPRRRSISCSAWPRPTGRRSSSPWCPCGSTRPSPPGRSARRPSSSPSSSTATPTGTTSRRPPTARAGSRRNSVRRARRTSRSRSWPRAGSASGGAPTGASPVRPCPAVESHRPRRAGGAPRPRLPRPVDLRPARDGQGDAGPPRAQHAHRSNPVAGREAFGGTAWTLDQITVHLAARREGRRRSGRAHRPPHPPPRPDADRVGRPRRDARWAARPPGRWRSLRSMSCVDYRRSDAVTSASVSALARAEVRDHSGTRCTASTDPSSPARSSRSTPRTSSASKRARTRRQADRLESAPPAPAAVWRRNADVSLLRRGGEARRGREWPPGPPPARSTCTGGITCAGRLGAVTGPAARRLRGRCARRPAA